MKPILPFFLLFACTSTPPKKVNEPVAPAPSKDVKELLQHSYYTGVFQNDRLKKSFPAVLDLVVRDSKDAEWELQGIFRIFVSESRVISSYFPQIFLRENEIKFAGKEQKIRVIGKGKWQEDEISGFVVVYGFGQGKLHLTRQEFVGESKKIFTTKSDTNSVAGDASKQSLETEKTGAPSTKTTIHVEKGYPDALPDFKLQHTPFPSYVFRQQVQKKNETELLTTSKNLLKQNLFEVNYEKLERSGIYYGILHHEHKNVFQYARIAFVADKELNKTVAVNTLFFYRPERKEFIVYHYNIEETPQSVIFTGRGETFLALDKWDKDIMTGVWYSKIHGRIGTIFFRREMFPRLALNAELVQAIGGRFVNLKYILNLKVENGVSQKPDVVFPSRISGTMLDTVEQKSHQITHGEYNFYRGVVTVSHDGGSVRYSVYDQESSLKIPSIEDDG